jgi:phosphatidylserine/phosphatidylglycerophosphate/cardiolipin synthase-like enzyme
VVTNRLVEMIDRARHSISITSFYFKPIDALVEALVRAAGRGVHVEVHHSHLDALPATELAWIAAAAHYPRLLNSGVALFENRQGEHSKIILVDETWVAFGSYNFEHAAHDRLAEAMLASRDPRAIAPVIEILTALRANPQNVQVTLEMLSAQPARLRFKRAVLAPLKRWM